MRRNRRNRRGRCSLCPEPTHREVILYRRRETLQERRVRIKGQEDATGGGDCREKLLVQGPCRHRSKQHLLRSDWFRIEQQVYETERPDEFANCVFYVHCVMHSNLVYSYMS